MTININKDVGSKSNITIKGLGDPGPFSFAIIKGSLPTGTTFDQATGEIKGNFTQKGDFDVTIAGKKKDRIQGSEDFTFKVTDWTIHRTDFKNLVDNNSLSWTTSGTVTKILNDPGIFDGECYEVNGRLTTNLPEAIGTRDFEIDYIFKPLNNGGSDMWGRILMIGPNSTSGMFYFSRNRNDVPTTTIFEYCPTGSTTYTRIFPKLSNPLINNDWNHILLVRKNGVLTYFLNGVREQETPFTHDMTRREIYIGANDTNSEKFYCRVKRLQIRVYDNSHFSTPTLVTDVWRYKLLERSKYFLKSTERNSYLIECNYSGNYTTRVKEGYFLPTGLTLRSNRITGDSDLTDNLSTTIELLVNGVVNDEVTIIIIDISKPYRLFELPMIGAENDIVFGDTQSRQWTRRGDVKIVKDTDNFRDLVATYFDGAGDTLSFTSDDFALGYDDFCYSFWLKPIANGGTVSNRRIINHGANTGTGTFILYNGYDNAGPNITLYLLLNGNWVSTLTPQAIKLNSDVYNHVVLARKDNTWRLLVNGKVVLESYYVFNVTAKGVYIAGNDSNTENYRGNYFDMKLSRYTLDYWAPFIPPLITKWSTQDISIVEQINTDIRRLFKTTWPYAGVTYKVKDTSALPLGLTLESSGLLNGTVTHEGVGETIIECYIDGVLNHTTKLVYDIMVNAKGRFLTHSIKASANSADGLKIVKSSNTITTTSVSPTMTEVGPMLSLEFKNPYTAYGSVISIPHAETLLVNKAFCMEAEVYFNGGSPVTGRQQGTTTIPQPLFSKSFNGGSGGQGFTIKESNGVYVLGLDTGGAHSNPLNVNVPITFDPNKRNHIAFTYDLDKLRFFLNGTLLQTVDWSTGWSNISNQPLEIGHQIVIGYPGYFTAFTGFVDNFNLYQGNAIYTKDFVPELNGANLYPEFPIVEPNKPYKGSIIGINGHTVSLLTGSLPPGLSLSTDGKLTGTCTVTSGDYPVTFTVVKGTTIENISVNLTVAQYILDLNLNNAITNGTLIDNIGNVFTVNGNPTIQADSSFSSGRSIYFNGTDSYLSIPADKIFKLSKSDFVIEFDFKATTEPLTNGGSYPGIIGQRANGSSQHAFSVWLATGYSTSAPDKIPNSANNKMSVGISTTTVGSVNAAGAVECSGTGLEKNKVYKVKFVRSGTTIRLYIDDRLMESVAISTNYTFFSSNQNLLIGCLDNTSITNRLFNGYLGSMRIYVPNSADLFNEGNESAFTPNNLVYKPVIYLDSSKANFATDATVTSWIDINNLHTFDTGVVARRPMASPDKLNNLNTIRFDGTKALYNNTRSANSIFRKTSYMWGLLVFKKTTADTGDTDRIIFGAYTGGNGYERFGLRSNYSSNWNGMNFRNKFSTGSRVADGGDWIGRTHSTTLDTDWVIALTMVDFVSGKNYMILNGVKEEYPLPLTGMTPDTDSVNYLTLGNHPGGSSLSYGFIGDIATFISGNRSLSSDEMDKLIGWAAHNYDLTRLLPNDHPYKTVAPTTVDKYDPYYENVYALFPFEKDLLDTTNKIWSVEGNPAISQEKVIIGNSSAKFTGTASSVYINQLLRNNDTFTIDFWAYILNDSTGNANNAWHTVVGQSGSGGAQDQFFGIEGGTTNTRRVLFSRQTNLGNAIDVQSTLTVPDNQWNHIELSWDGIAYRLFVNGVLDKIANCPIGWVDTGLPFRIGRNLNPGYPQYVSGIQGYLKYFRVTKGIVRHKSSFVPPTTVQEYTPSLSNTNTSDFRNRALELQPIGYWPLDDNSGTVARDISGNGFHGNIAWGTPTFNAPRLRTGSSKSMGFLDGTGCLQIPIEQAGSLISGLNATGKEFTIIYLEQATKITTQNIGLCGFKNPLSGDYALRLISGNTLQAKGSGDVTVTGLELNKTRFIAWKKDFQQGLFKALVNGVWYTGGAVNPATAGDTFSYPLMLPGSGNQSYNHYPINGYYSDLIIFNKALSDTQIEELYALLDRPAVLPDAEDIVPSNLKMALIGNSLDFEASINAMPITVNGNVSIIPNGGRDTDSLKFAAGSSLEFNYPDVFNIGSKPFAVEFDVNLTSGFGSTDGTEQAPIITNITSAKGLSYEWFIGIGNTYAKIYYARRGNAYSEVTLPWPDGITLTPGVKYTVVIQRDTEGKVCCYLNGKRGTKYRLTPWGSAPVPGSDANGLYTMNVDFGNIGKPIRVGNFLGSYQLLGELSNLKVYIGQHLYNNSTYKLPEASGRKQFRYYKMNILSGMSSWTELQEMELATTVNGEDVTTPTTPVTAIGYWSGGIEVMKPEGLVDNDLTDPNTGAWCHSSTSYPQWVTFDLGQPLRLDEVRIMGRNKSGHYDRGPKHFEIQGSNDNSSWVLLNTLTANDTYKSLTYKRFRLTPIKYRYYKMEIFGTEGGDGYSGIGRVLYGLNNVIITTSLNTKVSASSFHSLNPVTNLIKSDNPQNGDDAWASSTPTLPQWIIHDFGIATEIDQIRMIPQLSPHNQRAPKFFRILGSNDGAIWDTIKDFRNVTGWTSGTWNILSLTDQDEDK